MTRACFFCVFVCFQGNRVRKFCRGRDRHSSCPSHLKATSNPMLTSRRHRARYMRHEGRAGIVVLISCCLVRLNNGGLDPPDEVALSLSACAQRSIFRCATPASRLEPLTFIDDKRGRSKALFFFCCDQRNIYYRSRTCQFFTTQRTGSTDEMKWRHAQKTLSPLVSVSPLAMLDWLPACVTHSGHVLVFAECCGADSTAHCQHSHRIPD